MAIGMKPAKPTCRCDYGFPQGQSVIFLFFDALTICLKSLGQ